MKWLVSVLYGKSFPKVWISVHCACMYMYELQSCGKHCNGTYYR